jgi:hypothetical protein
LPNPSTRPEFNPSADERITQIKSASQALIELCQEHQKEYHNDARCLSIAITKYEEGAMWAVKGVTANLKGPNGA